MKVKLSDIAKNIGISVAAVSVAINNKNGVSEETRQKVFEVAEEMGYHFKKNQKTPDEKKFIKLLRIKKHGLVLTDTAFFSELIEGVSLQCKGKGYELLISELVLGENQRDQILEEYHENIDGLIVLCTELEQEDIEGIMDLGCPVVVLDSKFDDNVDTILMNNEKACQQAVQYLVDQGFLQIGYLKSSIPIYNFKSRFKSYKESISYHQLTIDTKQIIDLAPTLEGAYEDMITLLEVIGVDSLAPAFIADNDIIALGAMNAMKEKGIAIPEDISIVGIDDMPFCKMVSPQLTTIRIHKEEIGRHAVNILVEKINKDFLYTQTVLVDTELIVRESVKIKK